MSQEIRYLTDIIDAETLESAWKAVVGLAGEIGVGAIVETRYRKAGEESARLELVRFHLDKNLPTGTGGMDVPPATGAREERLEAPANVTALLGFDPVDLPLRAMNGADGTDPFAAHLARIFRSNHDLRLVPVLSVPLTPAEDKIAAEFLTFFASRQLEPDALSLLGSIAGAFAGKAMVLEKDDGRQARIELRPSEIECIRWAVAGKSLQDIADITGISHRGVRYRIDQARERYGYATNLQTYVRAAVDYGLDPMTPPSQDAYDPCDGSGPPPAKS